MSTQSDETRERWSKATPGPWSVHPDPEAIASAPEEVRVLLAEIDRLHARAERAEKLLGRFREEVVAAGCPSGDSDHQLHHLRRLLESVREDRQRIEPELRDPVGPLPAMGQLPQRPSQHHRGCRVAT